MYTNEQFYPMPPEPTDPTTRRDHTKHPCRCGKPLGRWKQWWLYHGRICKRGHDDPRCFIIWSYSSRRVTRPCERTGTGCSSKNNPGYYPQPDAAAPIYDPNWTGTTNTTSIVGREYELEVVWRWTDGLGSEVQLEEITKKKPDKPLDANDIELVQLYTQLIASQYPVIAIFGCCPEATEEPPPPFD